MSKKSTAKTDRSDHSERAAPQRALARLGAIQALYQMDIASVDLAHVLAEFEAHRLGRDDEGKVVGPADAAFFRDIVQGVVRLQRRIDPEIDGHLAKGWRLNRIDSTLRAILRAGTYELSERRDVPPRVIIDQYVELSHAFFGDDIPKVVNGVLDGLARQLRAQEMAG
jgi:N utilization substance protein B